MGFWTSDNSAELHHGILSITELTDVVCSLSGPPTHQWDINRESDKHTNIIKSGMYDVIIPALYITHTAHKNNVSVEVDTANSLQIKHPITLQMVFIEKNKCPC